MYVIFGLFNYDQFQVCFFWFFWFMDTLPFPSLTSLVLFSRAYMVGTHACLYFTRWLVRTLQATESQSSVTSILITFNEAQSTDSFSFYFTGLIVAVIIFLFVPLSGNHVSLVVISWIFRPLPAFGTTLAIMRFAQIAGQNSRCILLSKTTKELIRDPDIRVDPSLRQCSCMLPFIF